MYLPTLRIPIFRLSPLRVSRESGAFFGKAECGNLVFLFLETLQNLCENRLQLNEISRLQQRRRPYRLQVRTPPLVLA